MCHIQRFHVGHLSMAKRRKFEQSVADVICARISNGESLRAICRDSETPPASTVFKWLRDNKDFVKQYTRAREDQADLYVDEIIEIADNDEADPQRSRLQIDARKWAAGKMRPKKYGEKAVVEHTGGDGGPIETSSTINVKGLSTAVLEELANLNSS